MQDEHSNGNDSLQELLKAAQLKFAPKSGVPIPAADTPVEHVFDKRAGRYIPKSVMDARLARTRARNTPAQRKCRAEKRAAVKAEIAALVGELALPKPAPLTRELARPALIRLAAWFKAGSKRAKLMKLYEQRYCYALITLLRYRHEIGIDPEPATFARAFNERCAGKFDPISPADARTILKGLRNIEAEVGPWLPDVVTAGDEGSNQVVTAGDEGSDVTIGSNQGSSYAFSACRSEQSS